MSLKRRKFILGGIIAGGSAAFIAHQIMGNYRNNGNSPQKQNLVTQANIYEPPPLDLRIVVISDLNSQYGSTTYDPEVDKAIALIPSWQPDLVLCGGDMIAGQKTTLTESQIKAMWAAFDLHVAAPLRQAKIPFGFTVGNHDASGAKSKEGKYIFAQERDLAKAYWQNSSHNPGLKLVDRGEFPFYYTFQLNDIFFLVWDASSHKIAPEQLAWVESALTGKIAQTAKMRLAIGHLPLYPVAVGRDKPGEYLDNAEELRSLLEKYQVHTYISGHHHAYYPGHRGNLQLLYSGLLGSGARRLLNSDLLPQKTLTVVDIKVDTAETFYTTYDITTMELVEQDKLPRMIVAPNGTVLRRDLIPNPV